MNHSDEYMSSYKLRLKDEIGEEHLQSIEEYHRDNFANDIKEVSLDYSIEYNFDVRVRFSKEYSYSNIRLDVKTKGAKEIALGISSELLDIIKENKTIHFIFYHNYVFAMYLVWLAGTNAAGWLEFPYSKEIGLFLFLVGIAYFVARLVSPYCTFATKNQEKRDKAIKWVINGLAGVFVFGVIATYLRNKLF